MLSQRGEEALHRHSLFSLLLFVYFPIGRGNMGGGMGSPAALEPMRFGVEEGHMIISPWQKGRGNKRGEGRCKDFYNKGEGKRPWIGERN